MAFKQRVQIVSHRILDVFNLYCPCDINCSIEIFHSHDEVKILLPAPIAWYLNLMFSDDEG